MMVTKQIWFNKNEEPVGAIIMIYVSTWKCLISFLPSNIIPTEILLKLLSCFRTGTEGTALCAMRFNSVAATRK